MRELAIFGGEPRFATPLHVGRPNIGSAEAMTERLRRILENCWLTNDGTYVREFEKAVQALLGVRHCVAVCNATIGLEIVCRALHLEGEVIIPGFTFVATAHALRWQRITPVFCDVERETHNIDPLQAERLIGPRTTGIIGVHLWGRPCATEALEALAQKHRLRLLFDAAHAFTSRKGGRAIGTYGAAEVLSFHATKFVNCAEGGAITTNDSELALRCRLMRNFGFANYDHVSCIGTNGKMSELSAALGLTNLEHIGEFREHNRIIFDAYAAGLAGVAGLTLSRYDQLTQPSYHYVIVEVDATEYGLSRDQLVTLLHRENVLARRYFYPGVHRMEPYRSELPSGFSLPATEYLCDRVLALPTGMSVSEPEVGMICDIFRTATAKRRSIRRLFQGDFPTTC